MKGWRVVLGECDRARTARGSAAAMQLTGRRPAARVAAELGGKQRQVDAVTGCVVSLRRAGRVESCFAEVKLQRRWFVDDTAENDERGAAALHLAWRRGFQGRDVEGHRREHRVQTVPLQAGMSSASVNPPILESDRSNIRASFLQATVCEKKSLELARLQVSGQLETSRERRRLTKKSQQGLSKSTSAQQNRGTPAGRALEGHMS